MTWFNRQPFQAAWQRVRRTAFNPERLRALVTRNFALKLLSVLIAFSLWFFVNFGERDTEEALKVPLELRNIPAHLIITSPRVDFVDVRVGGPRTLLGRIDRSRLSIGLDLIGVRPGPAVFRVDAESLNLPRGVKMVRINPAQVTLELERLAHKSVPVHVRLLGKPPPDLQVVETRVSPETVQVTGPASDIEDMHAANTEPLDVRDAQVGAIERELSIETSGEYLSLSANRVAAQVRIEEVSVTREFKHIAIEVHNVQSQYRVLPETLRLTLRGPKSLVDNLELDEGAVYIDAEGQEVGEHVVKPTVQLPGGVDLVSTEPEKVTLVTWKGKRPSRDRR